MTPRLSRRGAWLLAPCLLLAACQGQPGMVDPTAIAPPANLDTLPPPGGGSGAPPGAQAAMMAPGFDGNYAGSMGLVRNPGGGCEGQVRVYGMTVQNNVVRFGQFRPAPIGPDGGVQMVDGRLWLTGRFDGRQFTGELTQGMPGCTYQMVLNRS